MNLKKITSIAMLLSVIMLPTFAMAKNGGNDNNNENRNNKNVQLKDREKNDEQDRNENKNESKNESGKEDRKERNCFKAWGHFFAPGLVELNTASSTTEGCFIPFGIGKKFDDERGASTTDVTSPVIMNLFVNTGRTNAQVRWSTNEKSDSVVFYGKIGRAHV